MSSLALFLPLMRLILTALELVLALPVPLPVLFWWPLAPRLTEVEPTLGRCSIASIFSKSLICFLY